MNKCPLLLFFSKMKKKCFVTFISIVYLLWSCCDHDMCKNTMAKNSYSVSVNCAFVPISTYKTGWPLVPFGIQEVHYHLTLILTFCQGQHNLKKKKNSEGHCLGLLVLFWFVPNFFFVFCFMRKGPFLQVSFKLHILSFNTSVHKCHVYRIWKKYIWLINMVGVLIIIFYLAFKLIRMWH